MTFDPLKFPILRLPSVAVQEVLRSMNMMEMLFFSLTSKRSKTLLNFFLPKNHLVMDCRLGLYSLDNTIAIKPTDHLGLKRIHTISAHKTPFKIEGIIFECWLPKFRNDPIDIMCDGPFEVGAKVLMTHLAGSFHLPKICFIHKKMRQPKVAMTLMNHAKSLNLPIEKLLLFNSKAPPNLYRAFLNEGPRISQRLCLMGKLPSDFQYRPTEVFRLETLEIGDGHWVHLEDYMECREVIIDNASNSNMHCENAQSLNKFFKLWKQSTCKLEYLKLTVKVLRFEEITAGLEGENYAITDYDQSLDITRADGRKGTITLARNIVEPFLMFTKLF